MNAVDGFVDSIFGKDDDTQANAAFSIPNDDENGFSNDEKNKEIMALNQMSKKIIQKNEEFKNRHRCSLSYETFKKLFQNSNIHKSRCAINMFDKTSGALKNTKIVKHLVNREFIDQCKRRLSELK